MRRGIALSLSLLTVLLAALSPCAAQTLRPAPGSLQVTWLGCAGCQIKAGDTCILVDPFLSRPDLLTVLFGKLHPDTRVLDDFLRNRKVDYILVTHSHYDHVMDVPYIAQKTGAKVFGSESTFNLMRIVGLPRRQAQVIEPGQEFQAGAFRIKALTSRHSVDFFGDCPFKGEISARAPMPGKTADYKMGDVYAFLLTLGKNRIFFSGTANYDEAALRDIKADVAILGISNRQNRRDYVRTMLNILQPDTVIPIYYDVFWRPLNRGLREMPGVDLKKFYREVARARPQTKVVKLGFFETYHRMIREP